MGEEKKVATITSKDVLVFMKKLYKERGKRYFTAYDVTTLYVDEMENGPRTQAGFEKCLKTISDRLSYMATRQGTLITQRHTKTTEVAGVTRLTTGYRFKARYSGSNPEGAKKAKVKKKTPSITKPVNDHEALKDLSMTELEALRASIDSELSRRFRALESAIEDLNEKIRKL